MSGCEALRVIVVLVNVHGDNLKILLYFFLFKQGRLPTVYRYSLQSTNHHRWNYRHKF